MSRRGSRFARTREAVLGFREHARDAVTSAQREEGALEAPVRQRLARDEPHVIDDENRETRPDDEPDDAQADAISRLVATAAGLNTDRGDLVTLTSLPFNGVTELKPLEAAEQARQFETILSIARMVAMVLGPLMVALLVWMILRKGRPRSGSACAA